MNADHEFDGRLGDWLDDGPTIAPAAVLDGVLTAFPSIPQRGLAARFRWARPSFERPTRLAVAAALGALIAIGGVVFLAGLSSDDAGAPTSPPASPASSSGPSARSGSIDTSGWLPFTSAGYGLTLRYPAGWTAAPATVRWATGTRLPDPTDYRVTSPELDTFTSPNGPVFAAASQPLVEGTNPEAWLARYEAAGASTSPSAGCWPAPRAMARTTIDGVAAWLRTGCGATDVFAFADGRVYVMRAEVDPTLNRELFEAFLATVRFTPAPAPDVPSTPVPTTARPPG